MDIQGCIQCVYIIQPCKQPMFTMLVSGIISSTGLATVSNIKHVHNHKFINFNGGLLSSTILFDVV